MSRRFAEFCVRFRIPILIVALISIAPSIWAVGRVPMEWEVLKGLPQELESAKGMTIMEEATGMRGQAYLLFISKDATDMAVLSLLNSVTMQIRKIEGVESVMAVTDYLAKDGQIIPLSMLPQEARGRLEAQFFDPNRKMTWAAITLVSKEKGGRALEEFGRVVKDIKKVEERFRGQLPKGAEMLLTGISPLMSDLMDIVKEDRPKINVVVVGGVVALLGLVFLSLWIPVVVVLAIGLSILWNMALGLLWPGSLNIMTFSAVAAVQLGGTVDYCFFLLSRYREERKLHKKEEAMKIAISTTLRAILGAALTSIIGFGALSLSRVGLISEFGLFIARGIALSLIAATVIVPPLVLVSDLFLKKLSFKGFSG